MLAILDVIWTKYASNLGQDRDHICLQSYLLGPYMPTISIFFNSFLAQDDHFQGVLKVFEIDMWSPTDTILTEIAGIFGPYY